MKISRLDDLLHNTVTGVRRATCPECGALPGKRCIGARGKERKGCHRGRWNCYAELRKTPTGRMQ